MLQNMWAFTTPCGWRSKLNSNRVVQCSPCGIHGRPSRRSPSQVSMSVLKSADAMEFFRHREGTWESWRVTHHLAFRRAEMGESLITMQCLKPDDTRIEELCRDHDVNPSHSMGGCYVTWRATMAWDQEGENHEGSTIFALVPDEGSQGRSGKILRDRGYAEIVPIAGTFQMDDNDDFCLETPYEGGAVKERFAFDSPDVVNRTSTVQRFGGVATATFSTEVRVNCREELGKLDDEELENVLEDVLLFGARPSIAEMEKHQKESSASAGILSGSKARFAAQAAAAKEGRKPSVNSAFDSAFETTSPPSVNSAFSSGFGGNSQQGNAATEETDEVAIAAKKAGIDLSKVPPSMREEFEKSLEKEVRRAQNK